MKSARSALFLAALLLPAPAHLEPPMHGFLRADANTDGRGDVSDAVYTFEWLFLGSETWQGPHHGTCDGPVSHVPRERRMRCRAYHTETRDAPASQELLQERSSRRLLPGTADTGFLDDLENRLVRSFFHLPGRFMHQRRIDLPPLLPWLTETAGGPRKRKVRLSRSSRTFLRGGGGCLPNTHLL